MGSKNKSSLSGNKIDLSEVQKDQSMEFSNDLAKRLRLKQLYFYTLNANFIMSMLVHEYITQIHISKLVERHFITME